MVVIPEPEEHPDPTEDESAAYSSTMTERRRIESFDDMGLSDPEIQALATASHRSARKVGTRAIGAGKARWVWTVVLSLLAGAAAAWLDRPVFHLAAVFSLPPTGTRLFNPEIANGELGNLLNQAFTPVSAESAAESRNFVQDTSEDEISVLVVSADPQSTLRELRKVADHFLDRMIRRVQAVRETPSETETALEQYVESLGDGLAIAKEQVRGAVAILPGSDPRPERGQMLGDWAQSRDEFAANKLSLTDAATTLNRLRSEPKPSHGLVTAQEREEAVRADSALQNDLKELAVNLAEVRVQLLSVSAETPPLLDGLVAAWERIQARIASSRDETTDRDVEIVLAQAGDACRDYGDALVPFADLWRRRLELARTSEIDPRTAAVLEVHDKISQGLADFLFKASTPLSAMRSAVNALGQLRGDNARRSVLQSALARDFQILQTAHHRFEFSADKVAESGNFRLDAAMRSARGLHRRSKARLREIDERLERTAAIRAREQHKAALASAEKMLSQIRNATDGAVDELVALQDRLNSSVQETDSYLENQTQVEVATGRLEVIRGHFEQVKQRLSEHRAARLAIDPDPGIRLESCGVVGGPINLRSRIQTGAVTFGLVFIAMMLGQWLMKR